VELRTLLLNSHGLPHQILSWKEAICLVYEGKKKVVVLEEYDEIVSSPSVSLYVPAVMVLVRKVPPVKKGVKFSRANVFTRDRFTCQYCGVRPESSKGLTYDHVLPRSQGGKTTWSNIVSACKPCNSKKGSKTPDQAKMKLAHPPARPSSLPLHAVFTTVDVPEIWNPYLGRTGTEGFFVGASTEV
jgi:5-methylcytosine-specific restriction endonuclease McrA